MDMVPLYTRDGRLVIHVPVPPMVPPAEIIAWGERLFVWRDHEGRYCEGIAWVVAFYEGAAHANT